jgi:hypothetical protein
MGIAGAGIDFIVLPRPKGYLLLIFLLFIVLRYSHLPPVFYMTMVFLGFGSFSWNCVSGPPCKLANTILEAKNLPAPSSRERETSSVEAVAGMPQR